MINEPCPAGQKQSDNGIQNWVCIRRVSGTLKFGFASVAGFLILLQSKLLRPKQFTQQKQNYPLARPSGTATCADVRFGFDSYRIRSEAKSELHKLVYEIESRPAPRVLIECHADSTGRADYNRDLSRRPADAVKDWFVKVGAPDALRYTTVGKGEAEPIADNRTREGRGQNRRVDIVIG